MLKKKAQFFFLVWPWLIQTFSFVPTLNIFWLNQYIDLARFLPELLICHQLLRDLFDTNRNRINQLMRDDPNATMESDQPIICGWRWKKADDSEYRAVQSRKGWERGENTVPWRDKLRVEALFRFRGCLTRKYAPLYRILMRESRANWNRVTMEVFP